MEALKQKWNSSQGASILLALLFMLVCMMVGASVVMAAASNAGKIQSNKKEQQKYLAVSSALNLLCDELESVQYVGSYTYKYTVGPISSRNETALTAVRSDECFYNQEPGTFSIRPSNIAPAPVFAPDDLTKLKDVLPLFNNVNGIVAEYFDSANNNNNTRSGTATDVFNGKSYDVTVTTTTKYTHNNLDSSSRNTTYTLEVMVEGNGDLKSPVVVTASMTPEGIIYLNANMKNDNDFKMRAQLNPVGLEALKNCIPNSANTRNDNSEGSVEMGTVTWELVEIVKVNYAGGGTSEAPTESTETTP